MLSALENLGQGMGISSRYVLIFFSGIPKTTHVIKKVTVRPKKSCIPSRTSYYIGNVDSKLLKWTLFDDFQQVLCFFNTYFLITQVNLKHWRALENKVSFYNFFLYKEVLATHFVRIQEYAALKASFFKIRHFEEHTLT